MRSVKRGSVKLEFQLMSVTDAILLLEQYNALPKTTTRVTIYVHPDDITAVGPTSKQSDD